MYNTTSKQDKPIVIRGQDLPRSGGTNRVSFRCGSHGDKGKNTRQDNFNREFKTYKEIRDDWKDC